MAPKPSPSLIDSGSGPVKRRPARGHNESGHHASDNNAAWDADEDASAVGDPSTVKNEGPLESLGKAVSSTLLAPTPAGQHPSPPAPAAKPGAKR